MVAVFTLNLTIETNFEMFFHFIGVHLVNATSVGTVNFQEFTFHGMVLEREEMDLNVFYSHQICIFSLF